MRIASETSFFCKQTILKRHLATKWKSNWPKVEHYLFHHRVWQLNSLGLPVVPVWKPRVHPLELYKRKGILIHWSRQLPHARVFAHFEPQSEGERKDQQVLSYSPNFGKYSRVSNSRVDSSKSKEKHETHPTSLRLKILTKFILLSFRDDVNFKTFADAFLLLEKSYKILPILLVLYNRRIGKNFQGAKKHLPRFYKETNVACFACQNENFWVVFKHCVGPSDYRVATLLSDA